MEIPEWREVIEKIKAHEKNGTWVVTELPKGETDVGCRWIFTTKYQVDGIIKRNKARLMAKEFTQTYKVDYTEKFAILNTVQVLLSLVINLD